MQKTFSGSIDELKAAVEASGIEGHWLDEGAFWEFHADDGPALDFWPDKQVILLQGAPARKKQFEAMLAPFLAAE